MFGISATSTAIQPGMRGRVAWVWSGLLARELGRGGFASFGRFATWAATAGFVLACLLVWARDGTPAMLAPAAFQVLAWLGLIVAMGVAVDLPATGRFGDLAHFAASSGCRTASASGLYLASLRAVSAALLPQTVLLSMLQLGAAWSLGNLLHSVSLSLVWTMAAALTAVMWSLLARWAAVLSPARPRLLLAVLVLGPVVADGAFGHVPTVSAFIDLARDEIARAAENVRT